MKIPSLKRLQQNNRGMASFLITMFIMILLGLIVLGFSQLTRRDQRQSLDRQLSTQAYYAAESGVNDAIKHLNSNPTYQKSTCNDDTSIQPSGQLIPGYEKILDAASGISYTCVLIDSTPVDLEKQGVAFNSNIVFPLQLSAGGSITSIRLEWHDADTNNTATNCPAAGSFPATRNASCRIGMLRADIVPYGTSATPSRDALIDGQFTVFGSPINGGGGSAGFVTGGSPVFAEGNCTTVAPINCSLDIPIPAANQTDRFYIRLNGIYGASDVKVSANGAAQLIGGQAIIDATGKAIDVLRRVQVRVAIGGSAGVPGFALQTASSQCKRLGIDAATNRAILVAPASVGSICDPTTTSTTGP